MDETCSISSSLQLKHEQNSQLFSLKNNCLNSIINSFQIFNDAFVNLSSEETLLRRNLTYLQRVFTPYIISGLHKKGSLKDQYLSFLINKNLKELDIVKFFANGCSLEALRERITVVGHALTKVSLCSNRFANDFICLLPNLEVLRFTYCDDAVLKSIAFYCPNLRELYSKNSCSVTEEGLKLLCKRKDSESECLIKVLSMKYANVFVGDSTIIHLLHNMRFLEILELGSIGILPILYSMHKEELKNNTLKNVKKYNLTKIGISSFNSFSEMSGAIKVSVEVCPNVKTLRITYFISKINFDLFWGFLNLETLIITNLEMFFCDDPKPKRCNSLNTFLKSHGSNLKKLLISNIHISVFDLIESCPKLRSLKLSKIDFPSLENISVKKNITLNNLNSLYLMGFKFSKQRVLESVSEILLCSPSLNYVFFKDCMFENSKISTYLENYCTNCGVAFFKF